jgi:hypothetical protein
MMGPRAFLYIFLYSLINLFILIITKKKKRNLCLREARKTEREKERVGGEKGIKREKKEKVMKIQ